MLLLSRRTTTHGRVCACARACVFDTALQGVISEALNQLERRDLVRYSLLGLLCLGKLVGIKDRSWQKTV